MCVSKNNFEDLINKAPFVTFHNINYTSSEGVFFSRESSICATNNKYKSVILEISNTFLACTSNWAWIFYSPPNTGYRRRNTFLSHKITPRYHHLHEKLPYSNRENHLNINWIIKAKKDCVGVDAHVGQGNEWSGILLIVEFQVGDMQEKYTKCKRILTYRIC